MRPWMPLLILLLGMPPTASAGLITVEFEGVVTEPGLGASLGSPIRGSYTYGTAPVVTGACTRLNAFLASFVECANYEFGDDPRFGIQFEIEGQVFSFSNAKDAEQPLAIEVRVEKPGNVVFGLDRYQVRWGRTDPMLDGLSLDRPFHDDVLIGVSGSPAATGVTSLDLIVPNVSETLNASFTYIASLGTSSPQVCEDRLCTRDLLDDCANRQCDREQVAGIITSLRVVPEPSIALLLALFVLTLNALRRRVSPDG